MHKTNTSTLADRLTRFFVDKLERSPPPPDSVIPKRRNPANSAQPDPTKPLEKVKHNDE